MTKYYKVIGADNKSCHGGDFDWTGYLPRNGKPGGWTPKIENIVACERGYHVTKYWNMWYKDGCRVFECEADGVVMDDVVGVVDKVVCQRVRLIEAMVPAIDTEGNTGGCNTGHRNTGGYNTSNCNTGNYNTGRYNTGDHNTGSWNICDRSSGFFNTVNDTINVFNKPCKIATWEAANKPSFICFAPVGTYRESWRKAYDSASDRDKSLLVKLPNFDADAFYEISGIMVDPKTGKEVI